MSVEEVTYLANDNGQALWSFCNEEEKVFYIYENSLLAV